MHAKKTVLFFNKTNCSEFKMLICVCWLYVKQVCFYSEGENGQTLYTHMY